MKSSRTLAVVIAVLFALIACKKDALVAVNNPGNGGSTGGTGHTGSTGATGPVKVKTSPDPGVYLVGSKALFEYPPDPKPMVWKNNNARQLAYGDGVANAICAQDTNILIAGTELLEGNASNACFWYNKTIIRLTYNNYRGGRAVATAIAASGKNIYVAGLQGARAVYWKNGEPIFLSSPSGTTTVTGMVVKGDDVYISGSCYIGTPMPHYGACYWKNQVLHVTEDNVYESAATGIAVDDDGNVYLSGYTQGTLTPLNRSGQRGPVYWKNNTLTVLPNDMALTIAYGIALSGSDVYISGTADDLKGNSKAVVWTNGTPRYLPEGTSAKAIYAIEDNIYVTGVRPIDWRTNYGVVWKGDEIIAQGALTTFNAVLVVK